MTCSAEAVMLSARLILTETGLLMILHKELIAMWRYVQQGGELPDEISEEQYQEIKESVKVG